MNDSITMPPNLEENSTGKVDANDNQVAKEEEGEIDEELAKLRCASLQTEEVVAKSQRRKNRCADYPGLAFGSAMFGSDTMMKFNIIKNELHNIMKSQLRRVDGEVSAMSKRIKEVDDKLEQSEHYIKTATSTLAEAVNYQMEHMKDEEEEESVLSDFDAQLRLLEGKLTQARLLASE